MTAWYFLFEGKFRNGDPTFGFKGVCSGCIVPAIERERAYEMFINALETEEIDLVLIEDEFEVNPSDLDKTAPENIPWIKWHNEAWECGSVLFDPWQVFDPNSEEKDL